jgi:hypothetical protein
MADIGQFLRKYSTFKSTFRDTSYDSSHNNSLCTDEINCVINFDAIIEDIYPDSNKRSKSFDAIYVDGNNIYCIEFKNKKPSKINSTDVKEKFEQGKKELDKILADENIQKNNYKFIYCVVYQNCIEPKERYKCDASAKQLFGLSKYKGNIVHNVITRNVNFFTKEFKKKTLKELNC